MLARPPRERRTGEGGEKPRRDATAPRVHRRSGGSLHRTITSRAQDTSGEPLAEEEEVEGRGRSIYSKTTVRTKESHRHGSFYTEVDQEKTAVLMS
ncbi:hypothetical protein LDENG_00097000 [Lucifuga dentata]|nr:hypothetical protein LDENG_00097000 [Lucifuga dentata]